MAPKRSARIQNRRRNAEVRNARERNVGENAGERNVDRNAGGNENQNIANIVAQQMAALMPDFVTQVAAALNRGGPNVNPAAGAGLGRNENVNVNAGPQAGVEPNVGGGQVNRGCSYNEFMACKPKDFDGKGGAIVMTRWIEKMEAVLDISNCAAHNQVRFAASTLTGKALTWWNAQIRARGREAALGMSWEEFKALLTREFCPHNEIQKLENEFWQHEMVGADHAAYTDRFHDLARLVPHLVTPEENRVNRYIYGLNPKIRALVRASKPATIQSAIELAGALTDEKLRTGALTQNVERKRNYSENRRNEGRGEDKKRKTNDGSSKDVGKGNQGDRAPRCDKCSFYHFLNEACKTCYICNRPGHNAKSCKAVVKGAIPVNTVNPRACFECGDPNHSAKIALS